MKSHQCLVSYERPFHCLQIIYTMNFCKTKSSNGKLRFTNSKHCKLHKTVRCVKECGTGQRDPIKQCGHHALCGNKQCGIERVNTVVGF